mmetsp:Transcript_29838/g.35188  ORF Transcript_29838/g.35188 Transcript_29838/m.35188 type:complete len:811 (-) Transcript_29838:159-2591(-)
MAQVVPEGNLKSTVQAVSSHADMIAETPKKQTSFSIMGVSPKTPKIMKLKKSSIKNATSGIISMQRFRKHATQFMMGNRDIPPFMIEPNSRNKLAWDLGVITPLIAYLTLGMPFRMCFQNTAVGSMAIFEMLIDVIFMIDIAVNFRSAYNDPNTGETIYDSWKIAKQYIQTWFIIDVASGIPFGVLDLKAFDGNASINVLKKSSFLKTIKVLRFLKLSRLLKGTRIFRGMDEGLVDRIQDFMAHGTTKTCLRMCRIIFTLCFICHVMACLWVMLGRIGAKQGKENWLNEFFGFEPEDTEHGLTVSRIYLASFYYCFTTMTGVGYGDITPQNDSERGFAVCLEGIGGFTYAYIIGSLTSVVSMRDSHMQEVDRRVDTVSSYINNTSIPDDMGRRVRRFYRYFFANRVAMDESMVLGDLSTSLRMEVSSYLVHHKVLNEVMIFKLLNPIHWASLLPLLRPCVFAIDEVIGYQGECCSDAYIIRDGTLTASCNNANMGHLIDHIEQHPVLDEGHAKIEEKLSKRYAEKTKASALEASAAISGRTPLLSHMLALHPEHESLHHSLQLCTYVKTEAEKDNEITQSTDMLRQKASLSMFNSLVGALKPKKQLRLRVITQGQMVNVLSLLKVYHRNLETMKCVGVVECYAISNDAFHKLFEKKPEIISQLQKRVTETHYKMMPHETAPTEYGVPLYRYMPDEIKQKESAFLRHRLNKEKELADKVRRDAGIVLTEKDSRGSIHETWTAMISNLNQREEVDLEEEDQEGGEEEKTVNEVEKAAVEMEITDTITDAITDTPTENGGKWTEERIQSNDLI